MPAYKKSLALIDGNSIVNRAYFATPPFTTSKGFPTNAIFGFMNIISKIRADLNPDYMVVAFDLHEPTFRHKEYSEYKAGRRPMDEQLRVQIPVLKDILNAMNIKICSLAGYEADDIIGTLSCKFEVQSYIYTGDRDSYQLVSPKTDVCYTKRGVSDILHLDNENFKQITGLEPKQIIDLKALMGDKSDNIPGVPGIGEKGAMNLLAEYGSIDGIYSHIDEIGGALQKKLISGEESARFSYHLATILLDVPLSVSLEECALPEKYPARLKEIFSELEMRSYLSMDIYEEENHKEAEKADVPTKTIDTFDELTNLSESILRKEVISFDYSKKINIYDGECEYIISVRENLLDSGFYAEELTDFLKNIFNSESIRVILYDAKDSMHKMAAATEFKCGFEDVSIMKYLVESIEKEESLDTVLEEALLDKDKKGFGLYTLYERYSEMLKERNEEKLYREIEKPLVSVLYSMEKEGVTLDENGIKEFGERYAKEIDALAEEIYGIAGERFNINSPSQLGKILFEKLSIPYVGKKAKSGNYSTNADILEKLAPDYEIVKKILRYRTVSKLKSTYIDGMTSLAVGGRLHTTYTQTVTSTGRLSSVNPNLQNIPVRTPEGRELRKLFVAREGNVLIDADYSQIELRLLAHFSGCKELIDAYNKGEDIHSLTASQVFGIPLDEVTSEERRRAKAINFGIIYGMSAFGLSQDLGISVSAAQSYINKYFERYSAVKEYMDSNVAFAKENGYITSYTGRKRAIPEIKSSNYTIRSFGERAAMNMPLQGSSADIIKIAMIRVYERLKAEGLKAKLILQIHDELIIDSPEEEKDRAMSILKEEMENAVSLKVPLVAEANAGKSWYEAK